MLGDRLEKIAVVLIVVGVVFKLLELIGAYPLIIIGSGSLSIIYFLGAQAIRQNSPEFLKKWFGNNSNGQPMIPNFVLGYVYAIIMVASLFKIMLYPGYNNMLNIAAIGLAIGIGILLWQEKFQFSTFISRLGRRGIIMALVLLIMTVISGDQLLSLYYHDQPELIEALKELHNNPQNKALRDSVNLMLTEYENQ